MLDYKICKQLKEAGFPQIVNSNRFESHYFKGKVSPKTIDFRGLEILGKDTILIPTLSELIEACGKDFDCLERIGKNKWHTWNGKQGKRSIEIGDKTPEIAVGKLWLKLNKKN